MVRRSGLTRRRLVASALAAGAGIASRLPAENVRAAARALALGGAAESNIQYWYSEGSGIGSSLPALLDQFQAVHPEISVEPRSYVLSPVMTQALQTAVAADEQPAVMQAVTQSLQAALAVDEPPSVAQVGYGLLRYAANLPHRSDRRCCRERRRCPWFPRPFSGRKSSPLVRSTACSMGCRSPWPAPISSVTPIFSGKLVSPRCREPGMTSARLRASSAPRLASPRSRFPTRATSGIFRHSSSLTVRGS